MLKRKKNFEGFVSHVELQKNMKVVVVLFALLCVAYCGMPEYWQRKSKEYGHLASFPKFASGSWTRNTLKKA